MCISGQGARMEDVIVLVPLDYEETDGGHSNDSDPILNSQRWARHYVYLSRALGLN